MRHYLIPALLILIGFAPLPGCAQEASDADQTEQATPQDPWVLAVIQGRLTATEDNMLSIHSGTDVLLIGNQSTPHIANLDMAAVEAILWGNGGPFVTASPQASLSWPASEAMTVISVTGATMTGTTLTLTYSLDTGEAPQEGTHIMLTLSAPVAGGDNQGSGFDIAPTSGVPHALSALHRLLGGHTTPLGIRVHNPLDIRPVDLPNRWDGQIGIYHTGDADFAIFQDFPYGLRAGAELLRNYGRLHSINALVGPGGLTAQDGVITRWSPEYDHNDTSAYAARVARLTGFAETQVLNLEDGATIAALIRAMARVELGLSDTGSLPYTDDDLQTALRLAGFDQQEP